MYLLFYKNSQVNFFNTESKDEFEIGPEIYVSCNIGFCECSTVLDKQWGDIIGFSIQFFDEQLNTLSSDFFKKSENYLQEGEHNIILFSDQKKHFISASSTFDVNFYTSATKQWIIGVEPWEGMLEIGQINPGKISFDKKFLLNPFES